MISKFSIENNQHNNGRSVFSVPIVIGAVALSLLPCAAEAALPDAGRLLQEQKQQRPVLPRAASPQLGLDPAPRPAAASPTPDALIQVTRFQLSGDLGDLDHAELLAWLQPHTGKRQSFAALQKIADELSQLLRSKGYGFAKVYLPAQEVKEGTVQLTLLLGRIEGGLGGEGIVVQGEGLRLKPQRVRQTLATATLAQSPYLRLADLERGLLLLNDLPGVSAQANLDPSPVEGSARLRVELGESRLVSGMAWLDNAGNRYTGSTRLNGQINVNDPSGQGDQFYLQATAAEHLGLAKIGYSLPLGYQGLRLNASYSAMGYQVGKEFAALHNQGTAQTASLNASYPLIRSRDTNLAVNVGYDHKTLRDRTASLTTSDKQVDVWNASLSGSQVDSWGGGGMNQASLTLTAGTVDLAAVPAALAADHAGPQTQGSYSKLNYSLARLQRLGSNWAMFGAVSGQVAGKNLDSSEKFLLGGSTGVRAYPSGEASGDEGTLLNLELRYDLPSQTRWGNWQFVGFYDAGQIARSKTAWAGQNAFNPTLANRYTLSGAGLGVNLSKADSHAIRLAYAWKIGSNPGASVAGRDADGTRDRSRVWVQALFYLP